MKQYLMVCNPSTSGIAWQHRFNSSSDRFAHHSVIAQLRSAGFPPRVDSVTLLCVSEPEHVVGEYSPSKPTINCLMKVNVEDFEETKSGV